MVARNPLHKKSAAMLYLTSGDDAKGSVGDAGGRESEPAVGRFSHRVSSSAVSDLVATSACRQQSTDQAAGSYKYEEARQASTMCRLSHQGSPELKKGTQVKSTSLGVSSSQAFAPSDSHGSADLRSSCDLDWPFNGLPQTLRRCLVSVCPQKARQ